MLLAIVCVVCSSSTFSSQPAQTEVTQQLAYVAAISFMSAWCVSPLKFSYIPSFPQPLISFHPLPQKFWPQVMNRLQQKQTCFLWTPQAVAFVIAGDVMKVNSVTVYFNVPERVCCSQYRLAIKQFKVLGQNL